MAELERMYKNQNGLCAICPTPIPMLNSRWDPGRSCLDHCHATGRLRGILCQKCNTGLSNFKDDPELLIKAAKYL